MRERILRNSAYLGCHVDPARNAANEIEISTDDSTCRAFVIATNEELVIATDTGRIVGECSMAGAPETVHS